MKNKIFVVLFLLLLLVSNLALGQQPPRLHKWETKKILREQQETRHHIFDYPSVSMSQSHHQPFNTDKVTLSAIIPDFQVNENAGPSGADQDSPTICTDSSGNFVITWVDYRNSNYDIYAQRYTNNRTPLNSNFKVNDDLGIPTQRSPSICTDGIGNFVITWEDKRNGNFDIYAQRYSSDGSVMGPNFTVNDDQGGSRQESPSICTDGNGNFVITWRDFRNGFTNIYAQRFSSDGSILRN